jgi:hypothetical protein
MERLLVLMLTVGVCSGWGQTQAAANQLTVEEQREGFTLLFDGKSLDGWDVRPGQEAVWRVVDGVIENDSSAPGATLLTKQDFANYVLKAEFRAHPGVNSGLMLRQRREGSGPLPTAAGMSGYELNIRDKILENRPGAYLTGSIVEVARAPADAKIVPDQWNTFEVTMNGDHIVVLYNGRKVVDAHDSTLASGAIGLQSAHPVDPPGAKVEFRNLKVKRLP